MKINHFLIASVFAFSFLFPVVGHAQSASDVSEKIRVLMAQIEELQRQIVQAKSEINSLLIKEDLREGMSHSDIKKIQELLSTDSTIYPERFVTGYFGPLTKDALKRFQEKFKLRVTGEIDEETRQYLSELLRERFGDTIPPGLLTAPGIQKKVELRLKEGCDNSGKGTSPFCRELRIRLGDDDDDDRELEIEAEIENGRAKVKIEFENGSKKLYTFNTTDHDEIIDEIVDHTDLTESEVEAVIRFDDEDDNEDEEDDDDDSDDDDDEDEDEEDDEEDDD